MSTRSIKGPGEMANCNFRKGSKRKMAEDPAAAAATAADQDTVAQVDFFNNIFETGGGVGVEPVDAGPQLDSGDWKKMLPVLREQLRASHKREEIQTGRLIKLEKFNDLTRTRLRDLVGVWNRFDEDGYIFKNRIDRGAYNDLRNHLVTPTTVLRSDQARIAILEGRVLGDMAKNSGELFCHNLDAIQQRLARSGMVLKTVRFNAKSGNETSAKFLETIMEQESGLLDEEKAAFMKFREKIKALIAECAVLQRNSSGSISGDLAQTSGKLKGKIQELEYGVSKLRLDSAILTTQIKDAQATFQNCKRVLESRSQEELNNNINGSGVDARSNSSQDSIHQLDELEKLQKSEEIAQKSLRKLQFDFNNRAEHIVIESVPYKNLANSVALVEAAVKKEFEELEGLLDNFNVGQVISQSCAAEKMELEKQSKTRLQALLLSEKVETTKLYLNSKRYELEMQQKKDAHFQPLNKEGSKLRRILESRGSILEAERDHLQTNYEEALVERRKLLAVDKEMRERISDLENWFSANPLSGDGTAGASTSLSDMNGEHATATGSQSQNDSAPSSALSEEMKLKTQLRKAKYERAELQFQLDVFTNKIAPKPNKPSGEESLKAVRVEIDYVRSSIKKIKTILSLRNSASSLGRELEKKRNDVDALSRLAEPFGQIFDDLRDQKGILESHGQKLDLKLQRHQLRDIIPNPTQLTVALLSTNKEENSLSIRRDWQKGHDALVNRIARRNDTLQKLHRETVHGILARVSMFETNAVNNIQTAYCQSQLDKVNAILKEKADALHREEKHQASLIAQINKVKLRIERLETQQRSDRVDEVGMEEIRQFKELLLCSLCKTNTKDAIINNCEHVFCKDCLSGVKKCPKCSNPLRQKDVFKLYLV